ncbi:ammonium transporter [Methanosalsum natronophilum]|uniref:ammonium transporter n=1 Tax=Methanosalsum natronophilum TaxID=768733 RepID=UPI0021681FEB|nr:ammonium transporter [Methanosalsum natronophilum]MCS3923693.1 ammonium transporter Rh [Methanosalsum natronophilum]
MEEKNFRRALLLILVMCLVNLMVPAVSADFTTPVGEQGLTEDTTHLHDELHKYHKNIDVWFMLMLVAFLMLFIKKFEWGICLATLLVLAGSFITHTAILQFVFGEPWSQDLMILSVFCSITVVIAIGVFLGTVKMWQYFLAGILFAPAWVGIDWFMFVFLEGVVDPGGSMLVHMVAAYWGWGVILALREKRAFDEPMDTTTHSISFVWLASMLLFVLWPSFVTALLPADLVNWGMFTAYMAGLGSIISAYFMCILLQKKVDPLVYTYALLAGLVAIGSPLVSVDPWTALGIGLIAGAVSVFCFVKVHPWLCKKTGVLDVMGVHNLHGVPGILGGIFGAIFAAGMVNLISVVGVLILSLITGAITGLILKATRGDMSDSMMFSDNADFLGWKPEPVVTEDGKVVSSTKTSND